MTIHCLDLQHNPNQQRWSTTSYAETGPPEVDLSRCISQPRHVGNYLGQLLLWTNPLQCGESAICQRRTGSVLIWLLPHPTLLCSFLGCWRADQIGKLSQHKGILVTKRGFCLFQTSYSWHIFELGILLVQNNLHIARIVPTHVVCSTGFSSQNSLFASTSIDPLLGNNQFVLR